MRRWIYSLFATFSIGFLWLPFAVFCGAAIFEAAARPVLWLEAFPIRPLQRSLFFNSLVLSALTGLLSLVFGSAPALAMARGPRKWRLVIASLTALPLALPPTLMATAWLEITRTPPARSLASLAAEKPLPVAPVFIAAPVLALCYFPIVAFALGAALRALPRASEEAAHLFGSPRAAVFHFYWPLLRPAALGAAGVCAALALWEMGAPDLLDARTYSVEIYRAHSAGIAQSAAALRGLPMLLFGALFLWPALLAMRFYQRSGGGETGDQIVSPAGNAGLLFALALLLVSPLAPTCVYFSQLKTEPFVLFEVWRDNAPEIRNTILSASLGATALLLVALIFVSYWKSRKYEPIAELTLCTLPLLFPPITLAIALVQFYNRDFFALVYGGVAPTGFALVDWLTENCARYAMLLIGYAERFLPLALILLWEAARRVDNLLLEAAQNLGATQQRATRTILLPLLRPTLLGAAALLWSLCASELTVSVLVNQPGGQTLPVPIFNLMHIGSTAQVAALSLTLFALTTVVTLGLGVLLARRFKS